MVTKPSYSTCTAGLVSDISASWNLTCRTVPFRKTLKSTYSYAGLYHVLYVLYIHVGE